MKEAIYARLSSGAALSALVSGRITPVRRDQGAGLPAVVFHVISEPRRRTLAGQVSLIAGRMQIDCWGTDEAEADAVAKAVRARLEGARFNHSTGQVRGVFQIDGSDDGSSDADAYPFRFTMDFRVHFTPA